MAAKHIQFTKEMHDAGYTILAPNMLDFHFSLLKKVLKLNGHNVEILKNDGPGVMAEGLKYVHNDTCVPALLVIGQFIDALHSGKYDLNKVALAITQTGGGGRASNYIHLLRKALVKAAVSHVKQSGRPCRIYLTSNPSRTAARNLYRSEGFEEYDTGVFRLLSETH